MTTEFKCCVSGLNGLLCDGQIAADEDVRPSWFIAVLQFHNAPFLVGGWEVRGFR